jgi:hypothetical protein
LRLRNQWAAIWLIRVYLQKLAGFLAGDDSVVKKFRDEKKKISENLAEARDRRKKRHRIERVRSCPVPDLTPRVLMLYGVGAVPLFANQQPDPLAIVEEVRLESRVGRQALGRTRCPPRY